MRESEAPVSFEGLTRARALAGARAHLKRFAVDTADIDGRFLVFAACGIDGSDLLRNPDVVLTDREASFLHDFVTRRAAREPVTRIVGRRSFWTLDLTVRPDVLDPRGDTEAVVRLALRTQKERGVAPRNILDLGSGSGAILCALLSEFPDAFGVAVDLSASACAATGENLRLCGLASRAAVVRASWLDAIAGRFDLIVSNPPYIPSAEIEGLDLEVRDHDPHLALDGGEDGLGPYRDLLAEAPGRLTDHGALVLEFGFAQRPALAALAKAHGFRQIGAERDLGGRDRAIALAGA
jgi:release factor glutamine methyltransferase